MEKGHTWRAVAVALVALAACAAGIGNQFTQDDIALIRDSGVLHDLSSWRHILSSPYWPPPYTSDQYRPITSLLLAAQYVIGSGAPVTFRLFSYALYAAVSVAMFLLASRLCPPGIALCVALLFAAHPVHVEAVALAVGQGEIIVATVAMLMVLRYLTFRTRRDDGSGKARDWAVLAVLYAIAAFSKEQGLLLPALLIVTDLCLVRGEPAAARVRSLWKGYAALALVAVIALTIRWSVLGAQSLQPNVAEALANKTLAGRAVTMLRIFPDWLRLMIWPAHLRADYSPQEFVGSSSFGGPEWLGLFALLSLIAIAWAAWRRAPVVTYGLAWCGVALFPVSNVFIPTGVLIAERTLFLPSIGLLLAIGGALAWATERAPAFTARQRYALAFAGGALVLASSLIRSAERQRVWRDSNTLSFASVLDSPKSWRVQQSYAEAMFRIDKPAEGVLACRRAIELAPSPWWVRNSLARRLRALGREQEAVDQLRASLMEFPAQIEAYPELTAALIALGRYSEARSIADHVIAAASAPPIMVWLRQIADSAIVARTPSGSIRVGIRSPTAPPERPADAAPNN